MQQPATTPLAAFCRIAAAGIGGIAVLTGFFSLFLDVSTLVAALPLVAGFNGTVGGYNFIDKTKCCSCLWQARCTTALLFSGATPALLYLFFPFIFTVEWREIIFLCGLFSFVAAFLGFCFGNWIAKKAQQRAEEQ